MDAMVVSEIRRAVDAVCRSWEGTPYVRGQRMRGVAVDCANFVCAVLDELGNYPDSIRADRPPATLLGALASTEWHVAAMMRKYPHDRVDAVDPGDVVFVRSYGAYATHVLIAASPITWWHSAREGGVGPTSAGAWAGQVDRIYRPRDKHRWIQQRS